MHCPLQTRPLVRSCESPLDVNHVRLNQLSTMSVTFFADIILCFSCSLYPPSLLCISVKHKLFNENHRATAKKMLDSLDGDRRRKCRTSNIGIETNDESFSAPSIRKELLIVSSKKKRIRGTKQSKADDDESDTDDERNLTKKKKSPNSELLDDDGFLKHSDDEGEWSDVDDGTDFFLSGHNFAPVSPYPYLLSHQSFLIPCLIYFRHLQKWQEIN